MYVVWSFVSYHHDISLEFNYGRNALNATNALNAVDSIVFISIEFNFMLLQITENLNSTVTGCRYFSIQSSILIKLHANIQFRKCSMHQPVRELILYHLIWFWQYVRIPIPKSDNGKWNSIWSSWFANLNKLWNLANYDDVLCFIFFDLKY